MATITYRTTEEKKDKLAILASQQCISVNKMIDELVTIAITEREVYTRFQTRAAMGNAKKALTTLKSKALD